MTSRRQVYAVALRVVQNPLMVLYLVGWLTLAMSIATLIAMRG